jgi:hypothetical protein
MTEPNESSTEYTAYQHTARTDWGAAVLAWERDGKRGYLFEDGELRIFKDGYFHLMKETDVPADRIATLIDSARQLVAADRPAAAPSRSKRRGVTFDEQVTYFLANFPGGFAGDAWRAEHRAADGRKLKRHREPTIERASKLLSAESLDGILEGDIDKGLTKISKLFASTDLVPAAQARALAGADEPNARALISALRNLLWGEGAYGTRFSAWTEALTKVAGEAPTWMMATVPAAIVHPKDHLCVRATALRAQASSMAPRLRLSATPHPSLYDRALSMAIRVRDRLTEREQPPADLLDVHDFIRFTLSPRARKAILAERD